MKNASASWLQASAAHAVVFPSGSATLSGCKRVLTNLRAGNGIVLQW